MDTFWTTLVILLSVSFGGTYGKAFLIFFSQYIRKKCRSVWLQWYLNQQFNQEENCYQAGKLGIYKDKRERERERERERGYLYFKYFISLAYLNSGNYNYSYLIPQRNLDTTTHFSIFFKSISHFDFTSALTTISNQLIKYLFNFILFIIGSSEPR